MATDSIPAATFNQTKFRALIADDESSAREAISRVLEEDDSIEIVSECANGSQALEAIAQHAPDMLFVDVQLPDVPGFQLVEANDQIPAVVFTSAQDRYAARAFDAHAADYVLKPFQDKRLAEAVARAKLRVQMQRSGIMLPGSVQQAHSGLEAHVPTPLAKYLDRLTLRNGNRMFFQKIGEVDFFASSANYIVAHCGEQSHRMRSTMNDLERRLDPRQFVRIHRCTIINIDSLREFRPLPHGDYAVKLKDGRELTLSRNYRQQFRSALSALSYTQ